jgi:hypothetical protein
VLATRHFGRTLKTKTRSVPHLVRALLQITPTTANPMKHRNKNLLTPGFPRRADRKAAIREGIMCAAVVVFLLAFLVFAPGS